MAYAYEDDDIITSEIDEDEEELDENLNVKKKVKHKKVEIQENEKEEKILTANKLSVDELLAMDKKEYSIENLLEEEKEAEGFTIDDLLNKKDDKLFRLYLGTGYSKITSKQFNYAALFLGPIYLLYRKVYTIGFVWLFLDLFTLLLFPLAKVNWIIVLIFEILSFICAGMFANLIILNHVGTRILNCKMVEDDKEKLKKMITSKGGTNIILSLLVSILVIALVLLVYWQQITRLIIPESQNNNNANLNRDQVYFNGKVQVDEYIVIKDKVTIKVPDNFYLASEDNYRYYYVYQNPDAYMPLCSLELEKVKGYKTPELFISAIASYHLELEENILTKENNYIWKYINVTDSSKNIYYATTMINDDMYLLKLMYQYTLEDECGSHFDDILNSINNT